MSTGYFAQITDGVVTSVRRVSAEYLQDNPNLYPGFWAEVLTMDQYPAVGWFWDASLGFTPPPITLRDEGVVE